LATGIAPIPAEHGNLAVAPFRLSLFDQYGDEYRATGNLSVLRKAQRNQARVGKGSGLYGLDETGKPPELPVGEEARRRYIELLAQEKSRTAAKVSGGGDRP
jgi:hypothetical protein